jgi:hypothetical protein
MAQASVLTDSDVRRVFRIIATTRHAERNRLAFTLSLYAGLRVGEIAALTVGDVATSDGTVRREIKLGAHQTREGEDGPRSQRNRRTFEISSSPPSRRPPDRIAAQWAVFLECDPIDAVQGNLRDGGDSHVVALRTPDIRNAPQRERRRDANDPEAHGACGSFARLRRRGRSIGPLRLMSS